MDIIGRSYIIHYFSELKGWIKYTVLWPAVTIEGGSSHRFNLCYKDMFEQPGLTETQLISSPVLINFTAFSLILSWFSSFNWPTSFFLYVKSWSSCTASLEDQQGGWQQLPWKPSGLNISHILTRSLIAPALTTSVWHVLLWKVTRRSTATACSWARNLQHASSAVSGKI